MDLAEAYEISVSGGPLGRNSALPSVGTALCLVSRVSWVQVPHRAAQGVVPGWCCFVCDALACIP